MFQQLGIAVLLGLLVGLQREHAASGIAGMRTFPLITVLGSLSAMLAALDAWVERREAFDLEAEVGRILATPAQAGRTLLERAPFATWCRTILEPAGRDSG